MGGRAVVQLTVGFALLVHMPSNHTQAIKCQTSTHAQPTLYGKEVQDTLLGFGVVVGAMVAWPLANHRLGFAFLFVCVFRAIFDRSWH